MSDATIGYGSKLKRGDGGTPEIFTAVAEIVSFESPSLEADEVDVTNLDSAARLKEYLSGMIEPGEVGMEMNFLPTNITQNATVGIIADQAAGTVKNWQILFSDLGGSTVTFAGFVKSFSPGTIDASGALRASATIKVSGTLIWA